MQPAELFRSSFKWFDDVFAFLGSFVTLLTNSLLVVFTMAMLLLEVTSIEEKVKYIRDDSNTNLARYGNVIAQVQKYLFIKTLISIFTGILIGVILNLLGMKGAALWGFIAFLLNYIPNIGSILAAIPPVLVALISQTHLSDALILSGEVIILFVAVNIVFGSILEPWFMGKSLGLSPLVVFLSMVFWGWTWGIAGMLLSVPLTMTVKIFFENTTDLSWFSVLLGNEAPKKPHSQEAT